MQSKISRSGAAALCAGAFVTLVAGGSALAADAPDAGGDDAPAKALAVSGDVTVDFVGALSGGGPGAHQVREVDLSEITFAADFDKLMGWKGGSGSLTVQNTSGDKPNSFIGTLEGVDNNEVASRRARIFEAWLQQDLGGHGSLRAGLMDVNGEFYVNDASGVLIAPQFGIGSELAATGPGGPSTFPQTGLAVRLALQPTKDTYIQAGAYNALVGDPGDKGGVDTSFDGGVLEIVEAGWTGAGKLAVGAWRYSHSQDDLFDEDSHHNPIPRTSQGAYLLAEHVLADGGKDKSKLTGFLRAGFSDGDTGPFKSSVQVGALIDHAIASRPDSQVSFAVDEAQLGDKYRAASAFGGMKLTGSETHFEATYADKINDHLSIQPDIQYVINPGGDPKAKNALVALVRFTASF